MKQKQRKDYLKNKETLNFLIITTKMLQSLNALAGRNDGIFVVDISKLSEILIDVDTLLMQRELILDHDGSRGSMRIITGFLTSNNLLFCDIASSLVQSKSEDDKIFPCHKKVRNWFLSIPKLSKNDKDKYESIYKESKTEMHEFMQEHAEEVLKAAFSSSGDQYIKKKLH